MESEVSGWQYADKYYSEVLIPIYQTIRVAFHSEEYELAFFDIEQLFYHIKREAELNSKTKDIIEDTEKKIATIYKLKTEYALLSQKTTLPEKTKLKRLSAMKENLRLEVTELYKMVLKAISDLKMFLPKQEGRVKSGAERFKDKFIKPEFQGEI